MWRKGHTQVLNPPLPCPTFLSTPSCPMLEQAHCPPVPCPQGYRPQNRYSVSAEGPRPDLLDHDAVGARQLQPSGEVKGIHPAQGQSKDHHGQVGLDPCQVECRRDDHQHGVDEAAGRWRWRGQKGEGTVRLWRRLDLKPFRASRSANAFKTPEENRST